MEIKHFLGEKTLPLLKKAGSWVVKRKYRIIAAFIFYILMCIGLLGTGGPMRESVSNYLTGEGSFFLTAENEREFCQEFVPRHAMLDSVGISFYKDGTGSADCSVYVSIKDKEDNLICEKRLEFSEIIDHSYTYIDMGIKLKKGTSYKLCINFDANEQADWGVNVCGREYELKENQDFFQEREKLEVQLVTMYSYSDALLWENAQLVFLLCFLAALGIVIGPPRQRGWNVAFGTGIFMFGPSVLGYFLEMLTTDMAQLSQENLWINIGLIYTLWLILLFWTLSLKVTVIGGRFQFQLCIL